MVAAIHNGNNYWGNCIHYIKDAVLEEKEQQIVLEIEDKNR